MNEQEVYPLMKQYFVSKGFIFSGQPDRGDIVPVDEIRLDGHAIKVGNPPEIYWIECKGDDVNISGCLGDLAKLCFITYYMGGNGLFIIPTKTFNILEEHKEFISDFKEVVKYNINILNIETEKLFL